MRILDYLFRAVGLVASMALFLLGLSVTMYALVEGFYVVGDIVQFSASEERVIYKAMGIVDLVLLGFSIFIASVGIYELFVRPIPELPDWLQVSDIDALKAMLIKVAIVVMGISFMGQVVTWEEGDNLLEYGVAVGGVTIALSYFLSVKTKK